MKATATAANGLNLVLTGENKKEIIESAKAMALSNSTGIEVMFQNGDYNYVNFSSSPNGNGGKNWEITVE